jgi:hypothetical protein
VFISPDSLIPDPTHYPAYHRYLYADGNPLKYNDPTGHCATNDDGSRADSDAGCWAKADQIYDAWGNDNAWWEDRWHKSRAAWRQEIAPQAYADEGYLQDQLTAYWSPKYAAWGVQHAIYNPPPQWHEPVNIEVRMPGQGIIEAVGDDFANCTQNPLGCGRALDDVSVSAAGVALGCAALGVAPCTKVAANVGTVASALGTVVTIAGAVDGQASGVDVGVAAGTTFIGGVWGTKAYATVGFAVSIFQWIWDH